MTIEDIEKGFNEFIIKYLKERGIEDDEEIKEILEKLNKQIKDIVAKIKRKKININEREFKEFLIKSVDFLIKNSKKEDNGTSIYKYIPLLNFVTSQYRTGFLADLKKKNLWELFLAFVAVRDYLNRELSTSIFYTSQTRKEGAGYYISGEKEVSLQEILDEILLHLNSFYRIEWYKENNKITGYLYEIRCFGKIGENFREYMMGLSLDEKRGFSLGDIAIFNPIILSKNGKLLIKNPNILLFVVVDYILTQIFLESYESRSNFIISDEDFAEIFFVNDRLRIRRYYIFPNISEIYYKFYFGEKNYEYITDEENVKQIKGSKLSRFLFSFFINDKDFAEKSEILLDKLIYYLFTYGKLNGKILDELMLLLIEYNDYLTKKDKQYNIKIVKYLYYVIEKIVIHNMSGLKFKDIEEWGKNVGLKVKDIYENKYKYSIERINKIIERIINELKVEDLPGRFFDKLVKLSIKYEFPILINNIDISQVFSKPEIRSNMDLFFYVKALILSGLLKVLQEINIKAIKKEEKEEKNK
ncbi:MAG: hypothetical protein QW409_03725 [Candidatus Aenigmatarchaeota archaeon]